MIATFDKSLQQYTKLKQNLGFVSPLATIVVVNSTEVSYGPEHIQKQQIWHTKLMCIKGIAFLVGVFAPHCLVMERMN